MKHSLWTSLLLLGAQALVAAPMAAQQEVDDATAQGIESRTIEGDRQTRLTLKLKDRLLRDVVNNIRRKAGVNIIIDDAIEDRVTIDLEDVDWRQALELVAERAGCVVVEEVGNVLKVEKPPRVYFAFENADVVKVVDTIAKISGANIVISPDVEGTITLRLKDIPWRDALEATVKTLGYVVVEEQRGILRVVPRTNLEQDLVRESFQLRFVRPRSAYLPFLDSEYVRFTNPQLLNGGAQMQQGAAGQPDFQLIEALQRLSTPQIGSLEYFEDQNLIIVRDTKPVVDEIRRIVQELDVEPGQIFIDVKFVTTTNQDILDFGVDPGASGLIAQIGLSSIPITLPFNLGGGGFEDEFIAVQNPNNVNQGSGPFADPTLNLPAQVSAPNVIFGALDFTQVTAALRLLKQDTFSEIIQAPKLIALNHHEATIFVGETVRYAQARAEQGQAGGLQLVVEEAPGSPVSVGFQLLTIPHIVPGTNKVIMDIIPKSDALSGTGQTNLAPPGFDVFTVGSGTGDGTIALPRIASSTIATKVLLNSGQTAVLGGLVTDNNSLSTTRIPFLGDIPILGWLFKRENSQKTRSTLIVFLTPQIIRSPEEVEDNLNEILRERQELMQNEVNAIFGSNP
jgi:type IV pilus assembly protein PilQ